MWVILAILVLFTGEMKLMLSLSDELENVQVNFGYFECYRRMFSQMILSEIG